MPLISRRSFLNLAFGSSLSLLLALWGVALLKFLQPATSGSGGFGGNIFAGQIDEFEIGSLNHILAGRFYVLRTEDGLLALWHRCTHLGCTVPWKEDEEQFHCPCHGSLFNKVGEVTGGPAPRPLDIFPVTVSNREIWVDTGSPMQRTRFDPSQLTRA